MVAGPALSSGGDQVYKSLSNNVASTWWRDAGLRRLNIGILLIFGAATANGFDASLMNGLLAIPRWHEDIGDISPNILGLIIAAISLGGLPALFPAGWVSDKWGRKVCLAIGTSGMIILSIIQAFTKGPWAFLGTKIALGAAVAFILIPAPALCSEIAHPKHRGTITACFQTAFYWGAIVSAIVTLAGLYIPGSWGWRMPVLFQAFFPILLGIGLFIVPESPRYLIANGKKEQALDILARFHANGDVNDELVAYEFQEMCEAIEREAAAHTGSSFKAFFATKGNRHRLLICFLVGIMIQWAGNGIVSYYLAPILQSVGITDPSQQAVINLGLQIWNAIMAVVGALASEKYGRRPLWLLSACGMLVSFCIITALSGVYAELGNKSAGKAVVAFLFIFFGFYDIAFTPLSFAYPVEILPYKLRSRGLSVTLTTIFGAGFFNQYVNPIALDAIQWKFYFVYIGCLASFIVIIWFCFPETHNRSLEEIAIVFDGPEAETDAFRRASIAMSVRSGSVVAAITNEKSQAITAASSIDYKETV